MPSKKNDMLSMEELVHEIKENLRLKTRPSQNQTRNFRQSPYQIPSRSWNTQFPLTSSSKDIADANAMSSGLPRTKINPGNLPHYYCNGRSFGIKPKEEEEIDDPYELLQALIKSKNLVKEAVRRLQINNISTKKSYFEDSDDELSNSPLLHMCQLEL